MRATSCLFGIYTTSIIASKLLRVYTHVTTVPTSSLVVYAPTLLLLDYGAILVVRALFTKGTSPVAWAGFVLATCTR